MHPKDAEGIANGVDPDPTAPLGAVWSESALFAQTCLSENLGTLRYASIYRSLFNVEKRLVFQCWKTMWDLIVSVPDHCLSFYLGY